MNRKESKKYLISILVILFAGYALALGIFYLVSKDIQKSALFALIAALVPCASLTGSVFFGKKLIEKGKLTKSIAVFVCVLFPLTFIFVTVSGIFLIVPEIIGSTKVLLSNPQDGDGNESQNSSSAETGGKSRDNS